MSERYTDLEGMFPRHSSKEGARKGLWSPPLNAEYGPTGRTQIDSGRPSVQAAAISPAQEESCK
jgi:alkylation response protein AidB-like acyl-CoA dehydrogenase